jgi:hypothetical protein
MSFDEKDAPTDALLEVPKVVVAEEFDWLVKRSGKARGVVGLPDQDLVQWLSQIEDAQPSPK